MTKDGDEPDALLTNMPSQGEVVARDYETMMAEARVAFANSPKPDIMMVAHVTAEHIALNPGAPIDWQMFLELNKPKGK